jgi:hypothetical protein
MSRPSLDHLSIKCVAVPNLIDDHYSINLVDVNNFWKIYFFVVYLFEVLYDYPDA